MSTKHIALPKPKKGKFLGLALLVLALVLVIRNPQGAAAAVGHVATAIPLFLHTATGGAL